VSAVLERHAIGAAGPLGSIPVTSSPAIVSQTAIAPYHLDPGQRIGAIDLYAGTGGMSLGFADEGFTVTGIDSDPPSHGVFRTNGIGEHRITNLHLACSSEAAPVIIGGPPCRPWSAVNVKRRGSAHDDHALLLRYFEHLRGLRPLAFLMENVPPLRGDQMYRDLLTGMNHLGYSVAARVLTYSDFGAATTRKRLFTVGFAGHTGLSSASFFGRLEARHLPAKTVGDAIGWLAQMERDEFPDHEWSAVKTIGKYLERYESGRFGWKRLAWDEPAPSFGSVSKTYILHPDSAPGDDTARVLSVREVLCLMGFPPSFRFPAGTGLSVRYRMAANAVSPLVSRACAATMREMLTGMTDTAVPLRVESDKVALTL
jgi:DNA (cytosine-5)-methyltransferase 1